MNFLPLFAEANFDSVMNNGLSLSEKAFQAGQMLLMGLGTVFAVLFVIWLALTIFRVIVHDIPQKRANAKQKKAGATSDIEEIGSIEDKDTAAPDQNLETVAVITAAIQAYMDSQGAGNTAFKVASFKRKGSAAPWNGNSII